MKLSVSPSLTIIPPKYQEGKKIRQINFQLLAVIHIKSQIKE